MRYRAQTTVVATILLMASIGWSGAALASSAVVETTAVGNATEVAGQIASLGYPKGASTVVLVSGLMANLSDAVTAVPLAAALKAPLLLTASDSSIGAATLSQIKALGAHKAVLIGAVDDAAVHSQLPSSMTAVGYSGANRYATAATIAQALAKLDGPSHTVFVASGNAANLTDALTADAVAASKLAPILLVPPTGGVPSVYQAFLKSQPATYVVGAAAGYHDKLPAGTIDLAGIDRYTTAALVNQRFFPRPVGVAVTNAAYLLDALIASPWAGTHDMPIVMVNNSVIPGPSYDYLANMAVDVHRVVTVGSSAAISNAMQAALMETITLNRPGSAAP